MKNFETLNIICSILQIIGSILTLGLVCIKSINNQWVKTLIGIAGFAGIINYFSIESTKVSILVGLSGLVLIAAGLFYNHK